MKTKRWLLKKGMIFILLFCLLMPSYSATFFNHTFTLKNLFNIESSDQIVIQSITPKDDAFHGSTDIPTVEWWYFDCMFNENYSAHIGFKVFTFRGWNFLRPTMNIYQNQQLIINQTTWIPPHNFFVSEEYPLLVINEKPVMKFNKTSYQESGKWIYHLSYNLDDVGVNLTFKSDTTGWTYETIHEGWTVAIPKGTVKGTIHLPEKEIKVEGRGYHDHNWNFSLNTPARGWSWYWGKITGETLNLAWAEIKETGILQQTFCDKLGVLNTQKNEFIVIDPNNITFSAESYMFKDHRFIPTQFHILIDQDEVFIDVTLDSMNIHRSNPSMMTLHYWRYFVSVNGVMSYGDTVEELNEKTQIMEYMRFI